MSNSACAMNLYMRTTEADPETGRQHEREAAEVNLVGLDSKNGSGWGGWLIPAPCLPTVVPQHNASPL